MPSPHIAYYILQDLSAFLLSKSIIIWQNVTFWCHKQLSLILKKDTYNLCIFVPRVIISTLTCVSLPHVVSRMGKLETIDVRFFIISALDFKTHLTDSTAGRAFVSTFQAVAAPGTPYTELLACCMA